MNGRALYNENDPAAIACLRQLIADGVIAPGEVDSRSIRDLKPDDLRGYTQVHLFAGAGCWSIAARQAGWPDDRPLWTASCPCQPFSQAGKRAGVADERHLWPDVDRLVGACHPPVIVGEQVAGAAGYAWVDGVAADLDRQGYTCETFDIPAAAVDGPHIRQRLYWRAVVQTARIGRGEGRAEPELRSWRTTAAGPDASGVTLGDTVEPRLERFGGHGGGTRGRAIAAGPVAAPDGGELGNPAGSGPLSTPHPGIHRGEEGPGPWHAESQRRNGADGNLANAVRSEFRHQSSAWQQSINQQDYRTGTGHNRSFWHDAEWLTCHDGKARRAKPDLRLLVDGMAGRTHLWRLAGNSICIPLAAEFIRAIMECRQ